MQPAVDVRLSLNSCGFLSLLILFSHASATFGHNNDFYVGGVFQNSRVKGKTPEEAVLLNAKLIASVYVPQAKAKGVDILILPEEALGTGPFSRNTNSRYGEVVGETGANPCLNSREDSPALTIMSCAAKDNRIYLVLGFVEIQPCDSAITDGCPTDGMFIWNSQLAFGRDGTLIAVYHKNHLAETPMCPHCFNVPKPPDVVYFDTDFKVRFGMAICFDLLFPTPMQRLKELNVSHLVYSASWDNAPLLEFAVAIQQGLSSALGMNILASNNAVDSTKSGGGIYSNGIPLEYHFDPWQKNTSTLIVAKIPKEPQRDHLGSRVATDEHRPSVLKTSSSLDCGPLLKCDILKDWSGTVRVASKTGRVTCQAAWEFQIHQEHESYALVAFDTSVDIGFNITGEGCAIIKCWSKLECWIPDPELRHVYNATSIFDKLSVHGIYDSETLKFPVTGKSGGRLLDPRTDFTVIITDISGSLKLRAPSTITLFGIYATPWNSREHGNELKRTGSRVDVFLKGEAGYFCIKIPALLKTQKGTLLAFGEARYNSCSDYTGTDLVMKRSSDGGSTWSSLTVVYSNTSATEMNVIGNAAPVELQDGRILLAFCKNNERVLITWSSDDGLNWKSPRDISSSAIDPSWHWIGTGPPGSIQLSSGRILIPAYHGPFHKLDGTFTHSYAIYSDDGGKTFQYGDSLPGDLDFSNECQALQLRNGSILMAARGITKRLQSISHDQGETWGRTRVMSSLTQPFIGCEASTIRDDASDVLYFSNPFNSSYLRYNMSIHISKDSGVSWLPYITIDPGRSGYSSMVDKNRAVIGMLYERSNSTQAIFVPNAITYVEFPKVK